MIIIRTNIARALLNSQTAGMSLGLVLLRSSKSQDVGESDGVTVNILIKITIRESLPALSAPLPTQGRPGQNWGRNIQKLKTSFVKSMLSAEADNL